ncbi:MAG: tetratricopeptide repeat protein [Planctomycetes bacterium]|nr:tetratricopeptide repeat protein [Planctomycetota bacterium]
MKRTMHFMLLYALVFTGSMVSAPAQDKGGNADSSAAIQALQERLKALEAEEKSLEELAGDLAEGKEVRNADLWKEWLPPAVYFSSESETEDVLGIAGAAAELTQDLLGEKGVELERLQQLKSQLEGGKEVPLEGVEAAENLGLAGKEKMLDEHETELADLLGRYERLQFKERFQRSADLTSDLEGTEDHLLFENGREKPGEGTAEPGDPVIDPFRNKDTSVTANLLKLGEMCYRSGRIEKALEVLTKIDTAAHAEGARIHYMIGRCRERLNDLEGALEIYDDLERIYPDSFWAGHGAFARSMVQWKLQLGAIEGAPPEVARILVPQPDDDRDEGSFSQ